jgi:hypothetical protein
LNGRTILTTAKLGAEVLSHVLRVHVFDHDDILLRRFWLLDSRKGFPFEPFKDEGSGSRISRDCLPPQLICQSFEAPGRFASDVDVSASAEFA